MDGYIRTELHLMQSTGDTERVIFHNDCAARVRVEVRGLDR